MAAMKRTTLGLVVLSPLALAPPSTSAPLMAAALAADCNDDGNVTITGNLRTIAGNGATTIATGINGTCVSVLNTPAVPCT